MMWSVQREKTVEKGRFIKVEDVITIRNGQKRKTNTTKDEGMQQRRSQPWLAIN